MLPVTLKATSTRTILFPTIAQLDLANVIGAEVDVFSIVIVEAIVLSSAAKSLFVDDKASFNELTSITR